MSDQEILDFLSQKIRTTLIPSLSLIVPLNLQHHTAWWATVTVSNADLYRVRTSQQYEASREDLYTELQTAIEMITQDDSLFRPALTPEVYWELGPWVRESPGPHSGWLALCCCGKGDDFVSRLYQQLGLRKERE